MKLVLISLCFAVIFSVTSATDYCSFKCDPVHVKHTACNPPEKFPPECINGKMSQLDSVKQNLFVDLHNEKRNSIAGGDHGQPPACRMATMKWDNELAKIAALNVMGCNPAHDQCRGTSSFKGAGQNIAAFHTTQPFSQDGKHPFDESVEIGKAVAGWFGEVKDWNANYVDSFPGSDPRKRIGHYATMMADSNTHLGCAVGTYFKTGKSFVYITCNYARGVMQTGPVYEKCPKTAAKCASTNPKYQNLCSDSEKYDPNSWYPFE